MTAKLKKIVVDSNACAIDHRGPSVSYHPLRRIAWAYCANPLLKKSRGGEGLLVDLAIGGQGQLLKDHKSGRNHVIGEPPAKKFPQLGGGGRLIGRGGNEVGHQLLLTIVLSDDYDPSGDIGVLAQQAIDLPQLNPKASDLYLMIATAKEFNVTIS